MSNAHALLQDLNPWIEPPKADLIPSAASLEDLALQISKELRAIVCDVADERDATRAVELIKKMTPRLA